MPTFKRRWTFTAGSARTRRCARRRTGSPMRPPGRCAMRGERPHLLPVDDLDPVQRLWRELPAPWRGPVIGPGIENWATITENGERRLDLTGLPDPFPAELAWMAHWQSVDGTRSSVLALNQLTNLNHVDLPERHRQRPPC